MTSPSGAAPCGRSGSPWTRTWYEWHVLLAWMTVRQWHSDAGVAMQCDHNPSCPQRIQMPSPQHVETFVFTKWFVWFPTETVLWCKGPFWLVIKKAWWGSSPLDVSLTLPSRHHIHKALSPPHPALQQHSCCFTLFIHLETAKGWLLSDFCCYDVDVTSNGAQQILWNIGTRDLSTLLSRWRDLERQERPLKPQLSPERINDSK